MVTLNKTLSFEQMHHLQNSYIIILCLVSHEKSFQDYIKEKVIVDCIFI